jgi:hypothetical protein
LRHLRLTSDFDDYTDLYNSELELIRRELDNFLTRDKLESLKASADLVTSLGEI